MSAVLEICRRAQEAFLGLSVLGAEVRDAALTAMAEAIEHDAAEILEANREDSAEAERAVSKAGKLYRNSAWEQRVAGWVARFKEMSGVDLAPGLRVSASLSFLLLSIIGNHWCEMDRK